MDGTGLTQLTSGPLEDRAPDWSPDGRLIVFERGAPAFGSIYVIAPDGTGLRRLTQKKYDSSPAWAPDGTKIAFGRAGDIWVMSATGGRGRNITHTRSINKDEGTPAWQPVHVMNGVISGTRFADYLVGGPGAEIIHGGAENDLIAGGGGSDQLYGDSGNDLFYAQDGRRDVVVGGSGRDTAHVDRSLDRVRGVERIVRR